MTPAQREAIHAAAVRLLAARQRGEKINPDALAWAQRIVQMRGKQ